MQTTRLVAIGVLVVAACAAPAAVSSPSHSASTRTGAESATIPSAASAASPPVTASADESPHSPPPSARKIAVRAARALDVKTGAYFKDAVVIINGDKITAVAPLSPFLQTPWSSTPAPQRYFQASSTVTRTS